MEILGVSDLPPNDPSFVLKLETPEHFKNHDIIEIPIEDDVRMYENFELTNNLTRDPNNRYDSNPNKINSTITHPAPHYPFNSYLPSYPGHSEPNNGAYIYKYSFDNSEMGTSYNGVSVDLDLTSTLITPPTTGGGSFNAYFYLRIEAYPGAELGLMSSTGSVRGLRMFSYTDMGFYAVPNIIIASPTIEYNAQSPAALMKLPYGFVNPTNSSNLIIKIALLRSTGYYGSGPVLCIYDGNGVMITYLSSSMIGGVMNNPYKFLQAVSFVDSSGVTSLTCGAELKHVTLRNAVLFKCNWETQFSYIYPYFTPPISVNFGTMSSSMNYVWLQRPYYLTYAYNNWGTYQETIDIFYY